MNRKKELKEQYKSFKPDMGVFIIRSNTYNKCYIEGAKNLTGKINRSKFQLDFGSFPNKELQEEWQELGEAGFTFEILEILEYEEDEGKTDYSEELKLLEMVWEEKLLQQGLEFYKGSL